MSRPDRWANEILRAIPAEVRTVLRGSGQDIWLPSGSVVHESGRKIEHIYFMHGGICVLLAQHGDAVAEAGYIGREGAVGTSYEIPQRTSFTRSVVISGTYAFQMKLQDFENAMRQSPILQRQITQNNARIAKRAQHIAGCNLLHRLDARLCRWLQQVFEVSGDPEVNITQRELANMMGVVRSRLNEAIGMLERDGAVSTERGNLKILSVGELTLQRCCSVD